MDPTQRRNAFDGLAASARRVLLVAERAWFREALAHVLNAEPDLWVIGQAATLAEVREGVPAASMADVVVIECRKDEIAVAEIVSELRAANPRTSVLMLAGEREAREAARRSRASGAEEVVLRARSAPLAEIIGAVHDLAAASTPGRR